ncbi:MAG: peroxiredoxin [Chloracidobacterium sp.]|nr:peroxiredoxin [Chloracidobacterium sp.]
MSTATGTATENTAVIAKVGTPAPDFNMASTKNIETLGENVRLSDYKGKWLIMLFYPLDFTGVCSTDLTHFSARFDEFSSLNTEVLGVSTDSAHSHRAWLRMPKELNGIGEIKFPIASDAGGKLSRQYNILIEEPNISLRGLFIIDPEGVLQHASVNTPAIGRSVDETLRILQALQSGGFCAADWKPGDKNL